MKRVPITVRESPQFSAWADKLWAREERDAFVNFIARAPGVGDVIPGSGGFRKIRWGVGGKGKSGGARIIYFYMNDFTPLYLLLGYTKGDKDNLTQDELQTLRKIAAAAKAAVRNSMKR
ncbi:MAG: addiction module toxin RelE [Rhodospirillaceae bacterium]|nr:MAG: addiction module toxin RelE [Rhodospirillaceae bacterium]